MEKRTFKDMVLLLFILILAFVALLSTSNDFNFNYFKKYFMFGSTIIFLFIVSVITVNTKLVKFILKVNLILCLAYSMFYFFGYTQYYGGGLTLNYSNPNLLALWLLHSVLYSVISFVYFKSKILKILSIIATLILFTMILETRTRSVLLALFIFTIILVFIFMRNKFKLGEILTAIFVLFPLIFAVIYMLQIYNPMIVESLNFMTSPGKGLDSRFSIWSNAFAVIQNNLVFGNYYEISAGTGISQLLNTHIDVMASYGCLVFVAFIIYLYKITLRIARNCETKLQKIALASFFAVMIMGSGEAAFVSGSVGMYILSCSFLLIARYKPNNERYI
ncbi:MAG: O-antigen ligase family protein [Tissierellia bacterium]|nr:O-antigen ligase family protein [Tissierellia bacterium]